MRLYTNSLRPVSNGAEAVTTCNPFIISKDSALISSSVNTRDKNPNPPQFQRFTPGGRERKPHLLRSEIGGGVNEKRLVSDILLDLPPCPLTVLETLLGERDFPVGNVNVRLDVGRERSRKR